jgi:hypothetical protein
MSSSKSLICIREVPLQIDRYRETMSAIPGDPS